MIESNAVHGSVSVRVKVELAGVTKSAWNFQNVRASWGAPHGPPWSIVPTK